MHPKLESLSKLADKWNHEGAPCPSEAALARAQEILDALTEIGILVDDDEIDPDAAGGVAIYPDIPSHDAARIEIVNERPGHSPQVILLWWYPRYGKGGEPKAVTLHGPSWVTAIQQVLLATALPPPPPEVRTLADQLKACRTNLGLAELREQQVRDLLTSCELALEGRDATIDRLNAELAEAKALHSRDAMINRLNTELAQAKACIESIRDYCKTVKGWVPMDLSDCTLYELGQTAVLDGIAPCLLTEK